MSLRRMRDADGDVWEELPDGSWEETRYLSWLPSLEVLERLWGPLSEVTE